MRLDVPQADSGHRVVLHVLLAEATRTEGSTPVVMGVFSVSAELADGRQTKGDVDDTCIAQMHGCADPPGGL
jgi:hypothetical protein